MDTLQIRSIHEDVRSDPDAFRLATLVAVRSSMVDCPFRGEQVELGWPFFTRLVDCLHSQGIASAVPAHADPAAGWPLGVYLRRTLEAIESSPQPAHQWAALRETLGDELLGDLVGASNSSVRRYAAAQRATPDDVAARLHALCRIVSSLAGSYNDYGIRRWFGRPRTQLDGQSPAQLLTGDWDPDGDGPQRVQGLADALLGAGAAT